MRQRAALLIWRTFCDEGSGIQGGAMSKEKQTVNVFKDKNTGEWIKELDSTKERIELDEKDKVVTGMLDDLENLPYLFGLPDVAMCLCAAGYRRIPDNIGEFSDGYHTFNELYHHRAVLFSVICNMFPEKAWKSKLHDTGDMYDGMFIVGIETEQGQATYHYDIEPYWDMFKVKEFEKAPKYDGHTPSDAIARIGNLPCESYRK